MSPSKKLILGALTLVCLPLYQARAFDSNIVDPGSTDPGDVVTRPSTPAEISMGTQLKALALGSPDVFAAICPTISPAKPADVASVTDSFQFQDDNLATDSANTPVDAWDFGMRMDSRLVAMKMDIFVEGFYRNLEFETGGKKIVSEPWFKYDASDATYKLMPSGAGAEIFKHLLEVPGIYDAKTGLVTIYRGTNKTEQGMIAEIQKLAANPSTKSQGIAKANTIATGWKNGLFASNLLDTAQSYAGNVPNQQGAVLTVKVPATLLKAMIANGDVYMGYEMGYFELGFQSSSAILAFAQGLQQ